MCIRDRHTVARRIWALLYIWASTSMYDFRGVIWGWLKLCGRYEGAWATLVCLQKYIAVWWWWWGWNVIALFVQTAFKTYLIERETGGRTPVLYPYDEIHYGIACWVRRVQVMRQPTPHWSTHQTSTLSHINFPIYRYKPSARNTLKCKHRRPASFLSTRESGNYAERHGRSFRSLCLASSLSLCSSFLSF